MNPSQIESVAYFFNARELERLASKHGVDEHGPLAGARARSRLGLRSRCNLVGCGLLADSQPRLAMSGDWAALSYASAGKGTPVLLWHL